MQMAKIAPIDEFLVVKNMEPALSIHGIGDIRAYIRWTCKQRISYKELILQARDGSVHNGLYIACRDARGVAPWTEMTGADVLTNIKPETMKKLKNRAYEDRNKLDG